MDEKQLQEIEAYQNELPPGEKWEAREGRLISIVAGGKDVLIIDIDASPIEFEISKADLAFMACAREKLPALIAEVRRLRAVVADAIGMAVEYGGFDGAHHKMWAIDQMVRILAGDEYEQVVLDACNGEEGPNTYDWDCGIAP